MIQDEEIELTLGLSLNGQFGVDPKSKNLKRSSSSTDFLHVTSLSSSSLVRTCSLPVETEEETRKRKEAQMLRRLEAKRKRAEKEKQINNCDHQENKQNVVGLTNLVNGVYKLGFWGNGLMGSGGGDHIPLSQASSGSSGLSELDTQTPPSGMSKGIEAKSPQSVHSFTEHVHPPLQRSQTTRISGKTDESMVVTSDLKRSKSISGSSKIARNMLADMPCVWTKGDGPNGRRVEGFLYRYSKGEEVRIVCVCHGRFLSPAEFIKHAGGGDVEHPLRHIVVNPSPLL